MGIFGFRIIELFTLENCSSCAVQSRWLAGWLTVPTDDDIVVCTHACHSSSSSSSKGPDRFRPSIRTQIDATHWTGLYMALSLFAGTPQYQLPGNLGGIDNMQCRAEQTHPSVHPANKQCDTSSWPFPMTTKQRRRQYHNNRATRSNEAARAFARNPIDADNTTWYLAPGSAAAGYY